MYDNTLGRFISADTLVPSPGNPQSLNRYLYVLGNPLRYVDPTGHMEADPGGGDYNCDSSSGCKGNLPEITCKCDGNGCQLDPALTQAIAFYATLYGIPYDLLHVTQLTEYLNDLQTLQGPFDTYNLSNAMMAKYGVTSLHRYSGWTGLGLAKILESVLHPQHNPGVGYNNIHSETAWATQDYFDANYAGTEMANLVQPNHSLPSTIVTLATTDGNIRYAAA